MEIASHLFKGLTLIGLIHRKSQNAFRLLAAFYLGTRQTLQGARESGTISLFVAVCCLVREVKIVCISCYNSIQYFAHFIHTKPKERYLKNGSGMMVRSFSKRRRGLQLRSLVG